MKQDCGRLSKENTQLHEQLIHEAERYQQLQKESYQRTKKLEDQVAELSYWKNQAVNRYDALEKDNQGMRKRVAELIKLGEKRSKAGECSCPAQMSKSQLEQFATRKFTWPLSKHRRP